MMWADIGGLLFAEHLTNESGTREFALKPQCPSLLVSFPHHVF
jgi:hypothetical protein